MIRLMFEYITAVWEDILHPVRAGQPRLYAKEVDHSFTLPPADGRFFAYRRTRNGVYPVLVRDEKVGPPMEFVGEKHVLSAAEYGDTIAELTERYPAPKITEE
jgi:hypothetical protein